MSLKIKTNTVSYNLENAYKQKKPFTFYRKPNVNEIIQIIQKDNLLHFLENFNQKGFVFSPFNTDRESVFFSLDNIDLTKHQYLDVPISITNNTFSVNKQVNKKTHIDLVSKGIKFIKENQVPKVVLSRKEVIATPNFNLVKTFENLLSKYISAFVYVWYHPKVGLWLGATPETLLQTKNNNFETMSLAGTQEYRGTLDVKWEQKEIVEHQYVTNYIMDELTNLNISCKPSKLQTVRAGSLLHLKTMVSGRLKNTSQIKNLVKALHPTPAVCGLPKDKAKEFILKNEGYDRAFYTGFLGEINFEIDSRKRKNNKRNIENHAYNFKEIQTNLFVNLRCMQIKKNGVNIYVGGGITQESNSENEYIETVAKTKIMKTIISTL